MDVFGTGKTSLKFNAGRYLEAVQSGGRYTASNPLLTSIGGGVPPSTTRSWTDANSNFLPDCNLLNPARSGPAAERRRPLRRAGQSELRPGHQPAADL